MTVIKMFQKWYSSQKLGRSAKKEHLRLSWKNQD